jgi:head-tail adaptor
MENQKLVGLDQQVRGKTTDGAAEMIDPFNKYQVDSSPTEVVIRVTPIGALSRKDVFTLCAHLVVHASKLDDGSTQGDFEDYLDAVTNDYAQSGQRVTVTRDERDAAKIEKLTAELGAANQLLAEIAEREQAEHGQIKETAEERRLRVELQGSLDRETKMELRLKEQSDKLNLATLAAEEWKLEKAKLDATIASLRKDVEAYASGARKQ